MPKKLRSVALGDVLALVVVASAILPLGTTAGSRAREFGKRLACRANLKNIGEAAKIYANDQGGRWMVPPFRRAVIDNGGIDYLCEDGTGPGCVGFAREFPSTSETAEDPSGGTTAVSVTRAFWILVRTGGVALRQFICPSSGDVPDETDDPSLYYDFSGYDNISYGYQVPFGPRDTQPRENMAQEQISVADKGPYYFATYTPNWTTHVGRAISLSDAPLEWRPFNSFNHGGTGSGEGQNCLYADGHASFRRIPAVGVDSDNIYTLMTNEWDVEGFNLIHGYRLHEPPTPPYPGQNAFGSGLGRYSATDTLIYP